MELAEIEVRASTSPNEPLARFGLAAPLHESPGEAVCRLAQVRWRSGSSRERVTTVRGETEMQALCLAIRLMINEIEALTEKHGALVDRDGAPFDPKTFGLRAIEA